MWGVVRIRSAFCCGGNACGSQISLLFYRGGHSKVVALGSWLIWGLLWDFAWQRAALPASGQSACLLDPCSIALPVQNRSRQTSGSRTSVSSNDYSKRAFTGAARPHSLDHMPDHTNIQAQWRMGHLLLHRLAPWGTFRTETQFAAIGRQQKGTLLTEGAEGHMGPRGGGAQVVLAGIVVVLGHAEPGSPQLVGLPLPALQLSGLDPAPLRVERHERALRLQRPRGACSAPPPPPSSPTGV